MIVISPGASWVLLSRMMGGEQCGRWATLGARQLAGGLYTFYDNLLDENLQRAGFGAERGANICDYRQTFTSRLLHGITDSHAGTTDGARVRPDSPDGMPFYQHLNTSVSVEQYFGDVLICLTLVRVITIPSH